jgi:hypothetical protein
LTVSTALSGAVLPIAMLVGGLALIMFAAYLHYVALPGEHARRHLGTRGALAAVGVLLCLLGTALLR